MVSYVIPDADPRSVLAMLPAGDTSAGPSSIRFDGNGELVAAGQRRPMRDVVYLRASGFDRHSWVTVATRCDAWLPFDLRGRPQQALSDANAPRLRAALEAIERALGAPGSGESSKFAVSDGYVLHNHVDVCDEPIDISEFGYDESWIAAP